MSLLTVITEVQSRCAALAGIKAAAIGLPQGGLPADQGQYPRIVLTLTEISYTRGTFGPSGQVAEEYGIFITIYLGTPDMTQAAAIMAALPYLDRLRAQFASDPTMGGLCVHSELSKPDDTLDTFKDYNAPVPYPALRWVLGVSEVVAANA
jgi:hypothetical protein